MPPSATFHSTESWFQAWSGPPCQGCVVCTRTSSLARQASCCGVMFFFGSVVQETKPGCSAIDGNQKMWQKKMKYQKIQNQCGIRLFFLLFFTLVSALSLSVSPLDPLPPLATAFIFIFSFYSPRPLSLSLLFTPPSLRFDSFIPSVLHTLHWQCHPSLGSFSSSSSRSLPLIPFFNFL